MTQFHRWVAAALSGFFLVVCFPKLNFHPLVWISALPLFLALAVEKNSRRAFAYAYFTGAIFLAGSCYWFVGVMHRYGGLSLGLAVTGLVVFAVVYSLVFGAFGLVMSAVARRSQVLALLLSPFLWVAMEIARTYMLTGFPWNLLGYAVHSAGLRQIACMAGVYGLSFLAATTSALGAWAILRWESRWPRWALAGWMALMFFGNWVLAPPAPARASNVAILLQPDVPLDEEAANTWAPWLNPTKLNRLVTMSIDALATEEREQGIVPGEQSQRNGPRPLIIWAENPAPFYFTRDPVFRNTVETMARQAASYVVVNTVVPFGAGQSQQITNSAVVLDPQGREILQYDKIHLVPFGEYVPVGLSLT